MKLNLIMTLGIVFSTSAVNATGFKIKASAARPDEVVDALMKGSARKSSIVNMTRGPSKQAMLLGTVERQGREATQVLVNRVKGQSLDILQITLVRPLDKSVKDAVDNLPATFRMHNDIGPEGKKALAESGLKEEGLDLMKELTNANLVRLETKGIAEIRDEMDSLRARGIQVKPPNEVLMDQTIAVKRDNGQIENLDLGYISSIDDSDTAAAGFTIRLGIHKDTSPTTLRRILEIAQNGGKSTPVRQTTQKPASGLNVVDGGSKPSHVPDDTQFDFIGPTDEEISSWGSGGSGTTN